MASLFDLYNRAKAAVQPALDTVENYGRAVGQNVVPALKDTAQFGKTIAQVPAQSIENGAIQALNLARATGRYVQDGGSFQAAFNNTPKIPTVNFGTQALQSVPGIQGKPFLSPQEAQQAQKASDVTSSFLMPGLGDIKALDAVASPAARLLGYTGVRAAEGFGQGAVSNLATTGSPQEALRAGEQGAIMGGALNLIGSPLLTAAAVKDVGKFGADLPKNTSDFNNLANATQKFRADVSNLPATIDGVPVSAPGGATVGGEQLNGLATKRLSPADAETAIRTGKVPEATVNAPLDPKGVDFTYDPATREFHSWDTDNAQFLKGIGDAAKQGSYLQKQVGAVGTDIPKGPASKIKNIAAMADPANEARAANIVSAMEGRNPASGAVVPPATPPLSLNPEDARLSPDANAKGFGSRGKALEEPLVDNNGQLNVNRLNLTPEVKQTLSESVDANPALVKAAKGAPVTRKEVARAADDIVKGSNGTVSREQIVKYQAQMLNTRQALAKAAAESGGTMTPELANIMKEDLSQAKFLASSLSNRASTADPYAASPLTRFVKEITEHGNDLEDVIKKAEGIDFNDPKQAADFYRSFVKPKLGNWLDLLRYNSMLSSPNTQINNLFGNAVQVGLVKPTEKTLAGGIDFLHSAFTGKERDIFAGEGGAYLGGALKNIGEGAKAFVAAMKGASAQTNLDTKDIPLATSGIAGKAASALSLPMRAMEGMDQFFTKLAQAGEQSAQAFRVASGGKAAPEAQAGEDAARTLFRRELGKKGDGTLANAIDYLPQKVQEAKQSDNPIISNIAKWTLPFVGTPTNILKQGIEYSPAGILNLPGNARKTEALAKAAVGSAVFAGAATLLGSGRLTWGAPTSQKEKDAFYAAGRQPYAVNLGGKWVSYSKLGPLAFPIAMVAAVDDAEKNSKLDSSTTDQVITAVAKYGKFFADQSYLKSIGDMLSATSGTSGDIAKAVSNYPQQLVPYRAAMGWVARLADDTQRDAGAKDGSFIDKQVAQMMSQIPGLTQGLPARKDALGNDLKVDNQFLNAVSPLKVTSVKPQEDSNYLQIVAKDRENSLASQQLKNLAAGGSGQGSGIDRQASGPSNGTLASSGGTPQSYPGVIPLANGKYGYTYDGSTATERTPERAALALAKLQVANGDKESATIGKYVIQYDPTTDTGYKVTNTDDLKKAVADQTYQLKLQEAQNSGDYAAYEKLQSAYYNDLQKQKAALDPNLQADKVLAIANKQEDIVNQVGKYRSYGGAFKKPKKPRAPKKARTISFSGVAGGSAKSASRHISLKPTKVPKIRVVR